MTAASVADVLGEVERSFQEAEARHQTEILEVDQEVKNLETAIANLQQQLDSLRVYRGELGAKVRSFGAEHVAKAYRSIYDALLQQQSSLRDREEAVGSLSEARAATLPERMREGANGGLVDEFAQFRTTVAPTLSALPESYRGVILKHHQSVSDRLRDHIAVVMGAPIEVHGPEVAVDLVYAVDAPEGDPELLVIVLPVSEEVHAKWSDRPDGLGLWIAARVVQVVYETAAALAFHKAQVVAGGHEGLLVVEVDVSGGGAQVIETFEQQLGTVLAGAVELIGANLKVTPRRVHIDYLFPPEGDDLDGAPGASGAKPANEPKADAKDGKADGKDVKDTKDTKADKDTKGDKGAGGVDAR